MITIDELEKKRDNAKKRIAELRRIHFEFDGLTDFQKDELSRLRETLDIIEFNLDRHSAMTEYLSNAEPFGGPQ